MSQNRWEAAASARATCAAVLVAAGLAVGCGGGDSAKTKTVTVPAKSNQQHSSQQTTTSNTSTADGQDTTGSADAGPNGLASGQGSTGGYPFRFVLTQLKRSGDTIQAGARVEILSDKADASIQISETFGDGQFQKLTNGDSEDSLVFDGIALIDPQARKKYLVARDETGRCVCSNDLSNVVARPGAPVELQATLSAPPPNVTRVDVVVPNVKTFTNVPIQG